MREVTKLSQLTPIERDIIINDDTFYVSSLLGVIVSLKRKYDVHLMVTDTEPSKLQIESMEDAYEYINAVKSGFTPDDLVNAKVSEYVDGDGMLKKNIRSDTILYIDKESIVKLVEGELSIEKSEFLLSQRDGLDLLIKAHFPQKLRVKDIAVNLENYDSILQKIIIHFEKVHTSELAQYKTLQAASKNDEQLHPCLYGAWKFSIHNRRLPRKIGHDKGDEILMWHEISKEYPLKASEANAVEYKGRTYTLDGMWKQYHETYCKILFNSLLNFYN